MKQSEKPTMEQQKQSEKIAGLMTETEQRLAALNQELRTLDTQRDLLVGAETLDQEALTSLCTRQAAVETEQRALTRRIEVLAQQKLGAERQEAVLRLQAIGAEAERLVEAQGPLQSAYASAVAILIEKVDALINLHRQRQELGLEVAYWTDRYGLSRPSVPHLDELPDSSAVSTKLSGLFSSLSFGGFDSPWARKRSELRNHPEQRQHLPKEPLSVQAAKSEPLPPRATITIPAKPDHEEDHTPNRLRTLQKG